MSDLSVGQLSCAPAHRSQQLMQPGEREMRFRLHASCPEHRHAPLPRGSRGVSQQPRLPDPRVAAKHKRLAPRRDLVQHRPQEAPFLVATRDPVRVPLHRDPCRAWPRSSSHPERRLTKPPQRAIRSWSSTSGEPNGVRVVVLAGPQASVVQFVDASLRAGEDDRGVSGDDELCAVRAREEVAT